MNIKIEKVYKIRSRVVKPKMISKKPIKIEKNLKSMPIKKEARVLEFMHMCGWVELWNK